MNAWKRIALIAFLLVGATLSFGYWSLREFSLAIAKLDNSYSELSLSAIALTSLQNSRQVKTATSTPQVSFNYPIAGDKLTAGCSYDISLTSSTTINSRELTLIDAVSDRSIDAESSGLATSTTPSKSGQIPWTIGKVTDGEYYLSISKINDLQVEEKSGVFKIKESPNSSSTPKSCQQ